VVLQAVRLHGPISGADIARITNLTAQTVSLITKRLLDDELLNKGEPKRGRVGQPSVPLSLNPDGAFSVGVKVGRRSMDVLLIDFVGAVRWRASLAYTHADPSVLIEAIASKVKEAKKRVDAAHWERLQGVGIAAPLSMGGWQQLLGLPEPVAQRWQGLDLAQALSGVIDLPVMLVKDTAAACVAELVAGQGRSVKSFLYIFVDTFVGGGLVLDSHWHTGVSGNAGAVGSMSMSIAPPAPGDAARARPGQLLSVASLRSLELQFEQRNLDPGAAMDARALEPPWLPWTQAWAREAARAMVQAIHAAACLVDMEGVIIDGSFDRGLLANLLVELKQAYPLYDWEGVRQPALLSGTIGSDARAMGGALLPLYANFAPDREVFLKVPA
jgi:predicted NBD/HSP70 family sugar kinase